ncbi:hypothetical protein [Pseudochrobactrum sp. B5]|uniref:hypothetical protein n=1 Tax=Pseudochrobactrum sp. B5 TaxID=1289478 RepID=UPI00095307DB|nr:hypothetical protein [Pseudochrobactrum sp. B5]
MNPDLGDTRRIVSACLRHGLLRNQSAYVLATVYHETAHTMKPINEKGSDKYLRTKKNIGHLLVADMFRSYGVRIM